MSIQSKFAWAAVQRRHMAGIAAWGLDQTR